MSADSPSAAPTARLFVALYPSASARDALAALAEPLRDFRWAPPEQIHLTLRFIGEITDADAKHAEDALTRVHVAPFVLEPSALGVFPPRGQPTVVWAGVGSGHPHLHALRQRVDDALLAAGVPLDLPPFHPHLTLARVRTAAPGSVAEFVKRHRDFVGPAWQVTEFALVESELRAAGPVHRLRHRYELHA
jgi:2'-5' RNA ligase